MGQKKKENERCKTRNKDYVIFAYYIKFLYIYIEVKQLKNKYLWHNYASWLENQVWGNLRQVET